MMSYLRSYLKSKVIRVKYPTLRGATCLSLDFIDRIRQKENDGTTDFLLPFKLTKPVKGYYGAHKELIPIFDGVELGTWAIDCAAMDFFLQKLDVIRPNVVLEFGSGCSTCLFAYWMAKNNPDGLIVSVEQHKEEADRNEKRIAQLGFADHLKMIVLPQNERDEYIVDRSAISDAMNGRRVDFLFADGPAGKSGCRRNTLPDSLDLLNDTAYWFLHDSLRTPELDILRDWAKIPNVTVDGVVPLGKGIGIGTWQRGAKTANA